MIHILTMGISTPPVGRRQAIVVRRWMGIVNRLLQELGGTDDAGPSDARRSPGGDQGRHGRLPLVGRRLLQSRRRGVCPPASEGDGMCAGRPGAFRIIEPDQLRGLKLQALTAAAEARGRDPRSRRR